MSVRNFPPISSTPSTVQFSGKPLGKRLKQLPRALMLAAALGGATTACAPVSRMLNGMVSEDQFSRTQASYVSPTHASGYNADNMQHIEFVPSQRHFERELASLRAEFNRTGDLNLLNRFLHYRGALSERASQNPDGPDAVQLQKLDQQIRDFAEDSRIEFWMYGHDQRLEPMDKSTRYLIAARFMDIMHNRAGAMEQYIKQDPPLRIIMHEQLEQTTWAPVLRFPERQLGGYWSGGNSDIHLDKESFWLGVLRKKDAYAVAIHELMHGLDSRQLIFGISSANRGLRGMPASDRRILEREQRRLTEVYEQRQQQSKQGAQETDAPHPEFISDGDKPKSKERPNIQLWIPYFELEEEYSLSDYAFSRSWEFLPTVVESFYDTPNTLNRISPAIYDVLSRYFGIDPINDYRDLLPQQ